MSILNRFLISSGIVVLLIFGVMLFSAVTVWLPVYFFGPYWGAAVGLSEIALIMGVGIFIGLGKSEKTDSNGEPTS